MEFYFPCTSLDTPTKMSSKENNSVRHIPVKFNILADRLSRMLKLIQTQWSQSDSSQSGISDDGLSQYRSVCDMSQQQTSNRRVTYSRHQSSGNRCTLNEFGSHTQVCISPVSHNSCNTEQNPSVSLQDCSSGSSMASEVMVSRSTEATSSSSHKSPRRLSWVN